MSNNYFTPNMNLTVPIPTLEFSPNWAYDLNSSLTTIDSHNHSIGNGVQISPSGININADFSFNINNAVALRTVRFSDQIGPITAASPDLECLYGANGNLYWNNASGNQVQITNGASVSGSAGTITGLPSGTASASFQSSSGTFQFQQSSAVAANLDVGSIAVRYPSAGIPALSGNYILISAPSSIGGSYNLTLPAISQIPPSGINVVVMNSSAQLGTYTFNAVGQGMTALGADSIANNMTGPAANAIANTMSSTGADYIGVKMSPVGTTQIAATMTTANANTIVGKIDSTGYNGIAAGFSAANSNTILSKVTASPSAVSNTIVGNISTFATGIGNLLNSPNASYKLITGQVTFSGTAIGLGFSSTNIGTGVYTVTVAGSPLGSFSIITATPSFPGAAVAFCQVNTSATTSSQFQIRMYDNTGIPVNCGFMFIVWT